MTGGKATKLDKAIKDGFTELANIKTVQKKIGYACLPDVQASVARLPKGKFHRFVAEVRPKVRYTKGVPKADGIRKIVDTAYSLILEIERDEAAIARSGQKAGCFLLISNTLRDDPGAEDSR